MERLAAWISLVGIVLAVPAWGMFLLIAGNGFNTGQGNRLFGVAAAGLVVTLVAGPWYAKWQYRLFATNMPPVVSCAFAVGGALMLTAVSMTAATCAALFFALA